MFSKIKAIHKISMMPGKWAAATGIDTGDQGQIVNAAHDYVNKLGFNPEDAWLTALVNWMSGMPWQESKEIIAHGILIFLEQYEGKIALSAIVIINAREQALKILSNSGDNETHPAGNTIIIKEKTQEPKSPSKETQSRPLNQPPALKSGLKPESGRHEGKPLTGLAKEIYEAPPD